MLRKIRRQPRISVPKCLFCQSGKKPDYKEMEELGHFITDRGKILSRSRSGICAKHQRKLAREIKRARYLALLPFAVKA